MPSMKLGDRHWRKRQLKKMACVERFLKNNYIHGYDEKGHYTNCLFVTLTTDPKIYNETSNPNLLKGRKPDFDKEVNAWMDNKTNRDKVMKRLKRLGVQDYVCIVESNGIGFPHNHSIVLLQDPVRVKFHSNEHD